jgi:hypothetical protein
MKKRNQKANRLPKFKASILSQEELKQATGGLKMIGTVGGTAGTHSVCHVDGTDDADSGLFL